MKRYMAAMMVLGGLALALHIDKTIDAPEASVVDGIQTLAVIPLPPRPVVPPPAMPPVRPIPPIRTPGQ
jgi:hypothetical protein